MENVGRNDTRKLADTNGNILIKQFSIIRIILVEVMLVNSIITAIILLT